ncbi:DUF3054 domain-containing protein [Corynebacterium lowii]|uniref:DUF3054 domain-containing protein n=1 Tax=Corynebacterium lowii TaxID=1544413 RepID=A0A0Q1A9N0_9CORY|nr:DUF3054 domain-containing protein [Corynebacterium lowii]KQB83476.1 hypothetical protein Clow_02280 [Corynebacterium lowii]MDP9852522.1 hypothetical protein [Corynebacterium lowii]
MNSSRATRWVLYDSLAIALFALLARIAHRSEDMPLTVLGWLNTLWPFLLGIALTWAFLLWGKSRPATLWGSLGLVWPGTVIVGLCIWGLRHGAVPHWSFMIVAAVTSGILMSAWRAIAARRTS